MTSPRRDAPSPWRTRLRELPVFAPDTPGLDLDAAPAEPLALLAGWLDDAIEAGALQPHAASLATVDALGRPSVRTLILKDLDAESAWFATHDASAKGRDLLGGSEAALLLYWRERGRQVRLTGPAERADAEVSAADFLARHPEARARIIAAPPSGPMPGETEAAALVAAGRARLAEDPELVDAGWGAWRVRPRELEFWATSAEQGQVRLRYRRDDAGDWLRERLWP
ncbi:pyridoxine/pyridoxamine 5'-phosphate oxidase [Homoserinibacter sp. YIM 151385]|uniref:pyridoxine/pyridoxamine 5'-phosphate oxidase n=1 Tax=Homoserinibacter sp. YIM 151385 TaxID=2985506 RepID=UPI0022F127E0|nr:pyridoxal 5'-phosphate synthase [Homoserinibacter sp. YIM 151385]WBU38272.1 pyridoxal 5'-phosphate synthase [Homoserinibacter sp. YIM 151385]